MNINNNQKTINFISKKFFKDFFKKEIKNKEGLNNLKININSNFLYHFSQDIGYLIFSSTEANKIKVSFLLNNDFYLLLNNENKEKCKNIEDRFVFYISNNKNVVGNIELCIKMILKSTEIKGIIEEIQQEENGIIYSLIKYVGKNQEVIFETPSLSKAIDKLYKISKNLPNEIILLKGKNKKGEIISISAYDKENFIKSNIANGSFFVKKCQCGELDTITSLVSNNLHCTKCNKKYIDRIFTIEFILEKLEKLKNLISEYIYSGELSKKNTRCVINYDKNIANKFSFDLKIKRFLIKIDINFNSQNKIFDLNIIHRGNDDCFIIEQRLKNHSNLEDLLVDLYGIIKNEISLKSLNFDTSNSITNKVEDFLRVELFLFGITPLRLDFGIVEKEKILIKIISTKNNETNYSKFWLPLKKIDNIYDEIMNASCGK